MISILRTLAPIDEPELLGLCRASLWTSVLNRLNTHPVEAIPTESALRGEGTTALSICLRNGSPLIVIEYLLKVSFSQIGVRHIVRGTVLHEAVKHRANDECLYCLVQASIVYDQRNKNKNLAIPSLLGYKDELGRTPLHYMIERIVRLLDRGESCRASWNILRLLVEAFPESVKTLDADGNTPLILLLLIPNKALHFNGSVKEEEHYFFMILQCMVRLCPDAVQVSRRLPKPWCHQFRHEQYQQGSENHSTLVHGEGVPTPLSCALLGGRSSEVIDLLLNANRKFGLNPCQTIVTSQRETPLHIAMSMHCPVEVVSRIIQEAEAVVGVVDIHNLNPLDWLWIRHVLTFCDNSPISVSQRRYIKPFFLDWYNKVSNHYLGIDTPINNQIIMKLKDDLLIRMSLILPYLAKLSMKEKDDNGNGDDRMVENDCLLPLLHSACAVNCPLAMVNLALESSPKSVTMPDCLYGQLPLHHAANRSSGYKKNFPIGVSCRVTKVKEKLSPVSLVLSKFPHAARVVSKFQQLPLHLAIQQTKVLSKTKTQKSSCGIPEEIELLLKVYPESLTRRDGVTKVLPFMLAAEGTNANLELTYTLLRRDPSLLTKSCY